MTTNASTPTKPTITGEFLQSRFDYLPGIGRLAIKGQARPVGAMHRSSGGRRIQFGTKAYQEDRLIYCYHHGVYPTSPVSHLDGDKLNCMIDNLVWTPGEHRQYSGGRRGSSGVKGIQFIEELDGTYTARVNVFAVGKPRFGGLFPMHDLDLAILRRDELRFEVQKQAFLTANISDTAKEELEYCLGDDYSSPGERVSVLGDNNSIAIINKPLTLPLIRLCLIKASGDLKKASDLWLSHIELEAELSGSNVIVNEKLLRNLNAQEHTYYHSVEVKHIIERLLVNWDY